jgi:hypothetical protein
MSDKQTPGGGTLEPGEVDEFLGGELKPSEVFGSDPVVSMAVGRTVEGTGFALMRGTSVQSPEKTTVLVFQRRWVLGPESTDECLMIMHKALGWYLHERGLPTL